MKTVRRGVFETNSSSTHAIALMPWCESPTYYLDNLARPELSYSHRNDGAAIKVDKDKNVDIEFSNLDCQIYTIRESFIEKLRYILGLCVKVYQLNGASHEEVWPYLYHHGFWDSKIGKWLWNDLQAHCKSENGYKLRSISFVPKDKTSTPHAIKEDLEYLFGSRKYRHSNDKAEQSRIVERETAEAKFVLNNRDKFIHCDIDHQVIEDAHDAYNKTGKISACLYGFSPGEILFKHSLRIIYNRDG